MKTRSFRTAALAMLGALLLLAGAAGCGGAPQDEASGSGAETGADGASEAKALPGYPAPEIIGRDVRSGATVHLSAYRGHVVIITFWATWCPYCGEYMPVVQDFYREREGRVQVLAVGADGSEPPEALAAYAQERDLTFPVLHDGGAAGVTYRAFGLPTTVFVDGNGIVRFGVVGPMTREQLNELVVRTEELGNQPSENAKTEG